jgi:hypothetical protein
LLWFCFGYFFMNDDDIESLSPSNVRFSPQVECATV